MKRPRKRWFFLTAFLLLLFGGVFCVWWQMPLPEFWRKYIGSEQRKFSALREWANRNPEGAAAEVMRILQTGSTAEKAAAHSAINHGFWDTGTRSFPEKHLPKLIELYENGQTDVLKAIGHINNQKAADFVIGEILSGRADTIQFYRISYKKSELSMVTAYDNAILPSPQLHTMICAQMRGLRERAIEKTTASSAHEPKLDNATLAEEVARKLLEIIQDSRIKEEGRILAAESLGMLGESASAILTELERQAVANNNSLRSAIGVAIIKIKTPNSVESHIEDIKYYKKYYKIDQNFSYAIRQTLKCLQALGESARDTGNHIMSFIEDSDLEWDYTAWMDIRVATAKTLGSIKYTPAEPALTKAAFALNDWAFSCSAVKALGQFGTETAKHTLKEIVEKHPFPSVRMAALEALTASNVEETRAFKKLSGSFHDNYSSYRVREKFNDLTSNHVNALKLRMLRDKIDKVYYRAGATGKVETMSFSTMPKFAVKYENGYLLGHDEGEWGGGLVYYDNKTSRAVMVKPITVPMILNTKAGVLACGYDVTMGYSAIFYRVEMAEDGWPVAKPVFRFLPDAAIFLENDNLYVGWGMTLTQKGFEKVYESSEWNYGLWSDLENFDR